MKRWLEERRSIPYVMKQVKLVKTFKTNKQKYKQQNILKRLKTITGKIRMKMACYEKNKTQKNTKKLQNNHFPSHCVDAQKSESLFFLLSIH